MTAISVKTGLSAILLLALATTLAQAGDYSGSQGGGRDWGHGRGSFDGPRHRDVVGTRGLPSVVSGVGTFAGGLAAVRLKGNGIYIASTLTTGDALPGADLAPAAKIITIDETIAGNAFLPREACDYEAGVCVIRGSR